MKITSDVFLLGIYCALFLFVCTSLGSLTVYFFKSEHKKTMHFMMSLSSGVMITASFFSLFMPAIEYAKQLNFSLLLHVCGGFLCGILLMVALNAFLIKTKKQNTNLKMLFWSMTIHNIPESMCVGIAIALSAVTNSILAIGGVLSLTIAIGIQNIPEGASVTLPMYKSGYSKNKAFLLGVSSAAVEPVALILSLLFATISLKILPFLLSFAGATMIYVSLFELLPDCITENKKITIWGTLAGMFLMMILELCL